MTILLVSEGPHELGPDHADGALERLIGKIKECRRVATRYDKLAETFQAFVSLAFIRIWLKNLLSDRA